MRLIKDRNGKELHFDDRVNVYFNMEIYTRSGIERSLSPPMSGRLVKVVKYGVKLDNDDSAYLLENFDYIEKIEEEKDKNEEI